MGELSEFSFPVRAFLKAYPWRQIDPTPWTPLRKRLGESRLALVSSAGFVSPGEEPFDASIRGGDPSFREIRSDVDVRTLVDAHRSRSFDHTGITLDPNLALPVDRLRELVQNGRIGSVGTRHLSFMGSITAPGRLARTTAPKAACLLADDGVDAAILIPV